jgi:uncharacterized protein (DUF1800 family)
MPSFSRKQFFNALLATSKSKEENISGDENYRKYANKELPAAKPTMSLSLDPYAGPWTSVHAKHLISRTMFGVRHQDIDALLALTMSESVDLLLSAPSGVPDPPVNNYIAGGGMDITGVWGGETWVESGFGSSGLNFTRVGSLKSWWIGQMINQELCITEKMVLFWHNHFVTQALVVEDARYSYNYYTKLRASALGNFKSLAREITLDPAMLLYLNGNVNTKNKPDENYAREFQELFTLGKGNTPNYNEDDVKSAARVLTGWHVNSSIFTSYFIPQWHDVSDKQFSSFFNNKVIAGRTGDSGADETDDLINMIFEKNETAHFLCEKLYRFFVYYNITAEIDAQIIYPLSQILIANNYDVKPVLECLFKSRHFYDANNMGCYIKTPLDFYVGCLRTFSVDLSGASAIADRYMIWNRIHWLAEVNGLNLADPPNVAGWPAYHQSPAYYQSWINSSTLPARMEFADALLMDGIETGTSIPVYADVINFAKSCPQVADPELLINWLVDLLLGIGIDESHKNSLMSILLSGQASKSYWTEAWNAYIVDPSDINTQVVQARLRSLLITLLHLPEYQLC